jgi:hypothetical protein
MPKAPFVCTGHDGLDDTILRRHNTRPCKDDKTREAINRYQREAAAKRKADTADATVAEPAAPDYVDHFKVPAAAVEAPIAEPIEEAAETTPELGSVVDGLYPPKPKPAPPLNAFSRPSGGASRRLRGLTNLGYTPKELALRTGLSADSIWWLLIAPPATIKTVTHTEIDRAYKALRLELKLAPADSAEGRNTSRARALAELHDWAGPFAYENIDDAQDKPRPQDSKRDAAQLARAIAEAALDDIPAAPPAIDTAALEELQTKLNTLKAENERQQDTIVELQRAARFNDDQIRELRARAHAVITERDQARLDSATLTAANVNLHEQLAEAKFDRRGPKGSPVLTDSVSTVELDATLSDTADAFTIEFEPSPAGGFTLTLPTALLTR